MEWSNVGPTLSVFAPIAIAFAGGVWAVIKWGFGGVANRIDGVVDLVNVRFDEQNGRIDARFDAVDHRFGAVDQRFDEQNGRIDARFDAVDHRFESLDKRVDGIDKRIDEVRADLRAIVNRVDALQAAIVPAAIGPA